MKTQNLSFTHRQIKALLAQVDRQIAALEEELKTRLRQSPQCDILRSIPGIGDVAAVAILVECSEIGIRGRKKAASLAGVAPMTRSSEQWRGKAFIQDG